MSQTRAPTKDITGDRLHNANLAGTLINDQFPLPEHDVAFLTPSHRNVPEIAKPRTMESAQREKPDWIAIPAYKLWYQTS